MSQVPATTAGLKVLPEDPRPAKPGFCFYCGVPVGGYHKDDCTLIVKRVKVRVTVEYTVEVPASWDADMVKFRYEDSSWCGDNLADELERHMAWAEEAQQGCLCDGMKAELIEDSGIAYIDRTDRAAKE